MRKVLILTIAAWLWVGPEVAAQAPSAGGSALPEVLQRRVDAARLQASQFLVSHRLRDGGWPMLPDEKTSDPAITAIVGQHAHVVQPIRRVHGKLVVFGEGQILSNQSAACCAVQTEDGMLVFLHITVDRTRSKLVSIGYMPTWDRHPDYTVLPIGDALKHHKAPARVLRASYDRTTAVVGRIPHVLGPLPGRLP